MKFFALMHRAALCALALAQARCATTHALPPNYVAASEVLTQGGLLRFSDASGYLSYQTPTPADTPGLRYVRRARGEVCQNDLRLPLHLQGSHFNAALSAPQALELGWGEAAVAQGVADAMQGAPAGAMMYDITLDMHKTSFLGVFFRRQCLVVSGSVALPWPEGSAHPKVSPHKQTQGVPTPEAHERTPDALPVPLAPILHRDVGAPLGDSHSPAHHHDGHKHSGQSNKRHGSSHHQHGRAHKSHDDS